MLALSCATPTEETVGTAAAALSADQCSFFDVAGKVTICHATGAEKNPVVVIRVARDSCVNAHAEHAGDFVAVDGNCGPDACLAPQAPCDETLPCCEGTCSDGVCAAASSGPAAAYTTDPSDPRNVAVCFGDGYLVVPSCTCTYTTEFPGAWLPGEQGNYCYRVADPGLEDRCCDAQSQLCAIASNGGVDITCNP